MGLMVVQNMCSHQTEKVDLDGRRDATQKSLIIIEFKVQEEDEKELADTVRRHCGRLRRRRIQAEPDGKGRPGGSDTQVWTGTVCNRWTASWFFMKTTRSS